jgi:hypothetical protein
MFFVIFFRFNHINSTTSHLLNNKEGLIYIYIYIYILTQKAFSSQMRGLFKNMVQLMFLKKLIF